MNKETFAKYISNPSLLDNDSLPEIKAMLDEFPYFQSAWVLYIKNLHTIKDIRYESKLKTACAYISDRKHLHDILKGIAVKTQSTAPQIDETSENTNMLQTQNFVSQTEIKGEITEQEEIQATEISESSNHQIFEYSNPEPEEPETRNIETQKPESSNHQIFEYSNPEPEEPETRNIETQKPESSNHQIFESSNLEPEEPETINIETQKPESSNLQIFESSNLEPEEPETRNIETQKPESSNHQIFEYSNPEPEEPETRNIETQKPETEPPAFSEPDKPESLADRILRQAEEMRRAKAAAAYTENQNSESPVETQDIASQSKEIPDTTIVQTQGLASQQDENAENPAIVQAQFIASQPEEDPEEIDTAQPQDLVAQPDEIAEDASQGESKEEIESNVQTQNIASQEITPAQIKALLEKQLHDIGINANITFTGNSANIQFENIATDEKPEENHPEQPIAEDESSTEITTAPTIEEQIEKRKNDRNKKANLIDKFIESKARIVPKKDYHSDNKLSTESIIEDEELFTEQLAKIYIKQGHLEKALETYEKLYLKYPEKNIYFATRIEYVKRLMNK